MPQKCAVDCCNSKSDDPSHALPVRDGKLTNKWLINLKLEKLKGMFV